MSFSRALVVCTGTCVVCLELAEKFQGSAQEVGTHSVKARLLENRVAVRRLGVLNTSMTFIFGKIKYP